MTILLTKAENARFVWLFSIVNGEAEKQARRLDAVETMFSDLASTDGPPPASAQAELEKLRSAVRRRRDEQSLFAKLSTAIAVDPNSEDVAPEPEPATKPSTVADSLLDLFRRMASALNSPRFADGSQVSRCVCGRWVAQNNKGESVGDHFDKLDDAVAALKAIGNGPNGTEPDDRTLATLAADEAKAAG